MFNKVPMTFENKYSVLSSTLSQNNKILHTTFCQKINEYPTCIPYIQYRLKHSEKVVKVTQNAPARVYY